MCIEIYSNISKKNSSEKLECKICFDCKVGVLPQKRIWCITGNKV